MSGQNLAIPLVRGLRRGFLFLYVLLFVAMTVGCANQTTITEQGDHLKVGKEHTESAGAEDLVYGDDTGPTVVTFKDYSDPLQPVNRAFFKFNDVLYRYALTPLGKGYLAITPEPVDRGFNNFFNNLREPLFAINHLLQGEVKTFGASLARFGVNSTVGLLGLFDPAKSWMDIERNKTTFGQTLATYGVGYGCYIVIPVLGPSTLRDGATMAYEYITHPVHYILESPDSTVYFVLEGFQDLAPTLKNYPAMINDAEDPYLFIRNLYLQRLMRDDEATIQKVEDTEQDPNLYE